MPKQPINIRLDADLIAAADARAAATGTNRTALIDSALRVWLGRPLAAAAHPRVVGTALHDSVPHINGGHVVRVVLDGPPSALRRDVGPKPFTPPRPKGGKR